VKRNWVAVARPDRSLEYGRGNSSRYHIARRNGHERLPQLHFGPRFGLFHRLQEPVLCRRFCRKIRFLGKNPKIG
jgi:hypothetical protein